ncbi:MAG: ABC transporter permease [Proteobacteria bacterium]|nr:ABC transporter permease [Pseudomonadota bacterium]MBU1714064.1 ABC transporter permease [Pseudomonadota bacterium]
MQVTISDLAKKNIRRNLFRSIAIVMGVAAATGTIFSVSTIMQSVKSSLTRSAARLGSDIIVVPEKYGKEAKEAIEEGKPIAFYMAGSTLEKIKEIRMYHPKLKKNIKVVDLASSQLFKLSSKTGCCDVVGKLLVGFDPNNDFSILPWLKSGKKEEIKSSEILIGDNIPHQENFKIQLFGQIFTVAGKLEPSGHEFFDNSIFMLHSDLQNLISKTATLLPDDLSWDQEIISAILVRTNPLINTRRIANQIDHDVKGVKTIVAKQVQTSVGKQLFMLLKAVFLAGAVLWVIAFLLIAVIFSMIVNERTREMGLLKAMGARRGTIFRLTVTEASLLSFAGGSLGIIFGGTLLFVLKSNVEAAFAIPFQWPSFLNFLLLTSTCLTLGIITGVSAALLPAIRCSALEPSVALTKGD